MEPADGPPAKDPTLSPPAHASNNPPSRQSSQTTPTATQTNNTTESTSATFSPRVRTSVGSLLQGASRGGRLPKLMTTPAGGQKETTRLSFVNEMGAGEEHRHHHVHKAHSDNGGVKRTDTKSKGGGAGGTGTHQQARERPTVARMMAQRRDQLRVGGLRTKYSGLTTSSARREEVERPCDHHSFLSDPTDVTQMEQALLHLLEDFHSGKLRAFGKDCSMEQMDSIREQQEKLARLHFDLGAQQDLYAPLSEEGLRATGENMQELMQSLEQLSVSIERLHTFSSESQDDGGQQQGLWTHQAKSKGGGGKDAAK